MSVHQCHGRPCGGHLGLKFALFLTEITGTRPVMTLGMTAPE